MLFKQVPVGAYDRNFSYIVGDEKSKQVMLIDPISPVLSWLDLKEGWHITHLAATHGHFDHVGELQAFYERLEPKPTLLLHSSLEAKWGIKGAKTLFLDERQIIELGELKIEVLPTPGHEPGSVCFLVKGKLMTGDTLFIDGCGRADLPGSDVKALYHSLYEVIGALPQDTLIYPGHDYGPTPWATLADQKQSNPYLRTGSQEAFIALRMGKL